MGVGPSTGVEVTYQGSHPKNMTVPSPEALTYDSSSVDESS